MTAIAAVRRGADVGERLVIHGIVDVDTVPQPAVDVRGEMLDLNSSITTVQKQDDQLDETLKQTHVIAGFSYFPIPNVVIKADVRLQHTGAQNPALVINPPPNALPYRQNDQFLNIGVGYSF